MPTSIPIDQITLYAASPNAFNNSASFLSQFQQGWQNLSANISFSDGIPLVDLGSGLTADQMGPIADAVITSVIKEFPATAESLTGSMKVVGNAAEIGAFGFAVDFATKVSDANNSEQVLQAVISSGIDFGVNYTIGLGSTILVDALFTTAVAESAVPILLALVVSTAIDHAIKQAYHDDHKTIGDVFLDAAAQLSNTNLAIAKFSTAILETAGVAFMADFNNLVKQAEGSLFQYDPLLIDLNGDGIKTTTTDNGTFFNLTQNGFAFRTAWVNGNDGILVRDLNNNGQIDDSSELFGNQTVLKNGSKAANGFQALADLDSNHDGVINASDAAFSQLKVLKGDGTLLTLAQAGIQSFNLTSTPTNTVDTSGNTQLSVGSFTKTDNSTGQYGDYNLQSDTSNSIALQNVSVPPDIAALPNIKGFGTVYDLQQAMAMDTTGTLKGLVQSFINTTDPTQQNTLLDQILAQWTGTVDVGQYNSFITYMSPVHAAVVSQFAGHPYLNSLGYNDVHFVPAAFISQAYYQLTEYVYGQLMAQTQLSTYFNEIQASQDATTGQTSLDLTQVTQSLQQLNTTDHQSAVNTAAAFSRAFKGLNLQADETNYAAFYSSMTALGSDFKTAMDDADKIVVNGTSLNDTIGSTPAFASRDSRAMVLYGQAGDDILRGTYGNDSLIGGTGSDLLYGMAGDDTYIFNSGDGRDTIVEGNPYLPTADGGNDTLRFGTGINQNNVTFTQTGNNLVIAVNGTTDQVTVQNGLDPNKIGYRVENFVFGDGSSLTLDQVKNILQVVNPPSGNLNITGDPYANNALSGYDGNDTISGGSGDDSLYGGGGNDTLYAWEGNNYVQGDDGNDSINASGGNDTLIGGDGNDTIASSDGNDYMQGDAGNDYLSVGPFGVGNDTLVGGLDNDTLLSGAGNDFLEGDEGNDSITAGAGNDTLIGGPGFDAMYGDAGNDLYVINLGDGQDFIQDSGGNDTIQFGPGISANNLYFSPDASGDILTIHFTNSSDSITVQNQFSTGQPGYQIEQFKFNDGSILSAADVLSQLEIHGTGNADILNGSPLSEKLYGYEGNDALYGGGGNDTFIGGAGNDSLNGGSGNDTYQFSDAWGNDFILSDGGGTDSVDFSATTANLTINLNAGASAEATDGVNTVNWNTNIIENAFGGAGNDSLLGNSANNLLSGGSGNDTLNGNGGSDTLNGGDGNDLYQFSGGTVSIVDSSGTDTVDLTALTNPLTIVHTTDGGYSIGDGTNTISWSGNIIETILFNPAASQTVTGNSNSEKLNGGTANDTLSALAGDDTLNGMGGSDSLNGGDGNDVYVFTPGFGADTITDSSGIDTLDFSAYTSGINVNLSGTTFTDGANSLTWAGSALENIVSGSGNDTLTGNSGDNLLSGGTGNDSLTGGNGNDTYRFTTGFGTDTINDTGGIDTLDLSALTSNISANLTAGSYSTISWSGSTLENLLTGSGNDSLSGSTANNLLSGGAGNDTLNGSSGNDTLNGGDGNDTYVFASNWGQDSLIDSSGLLNVIDLTAINTNLTVNLNSGSITDTGADSVSWSSPTLIEQLLSGAGNDVITGNGSVASNLWGKAGNDTITGGSGNDTIAGGAGNDSLIGGSGDDVYIFFNSSGVDTISDTAGTDTIDLSNTTVAFTVNLDSTLTPEITDGLGDTVTWTGDVIENAVAGSANDTLNGNSGNNLLTGNAGNDTINGGNGNDTLTGGTGNDSLAGGAGDDVYKFVSGFGTDTINDSSGSNTLDLGGYTSNLATVSLAGTSFVDGVNTVSWAANTLQNLVTGSGNDSLSGNALDNLLTAGAGNDSLNGGSGNDTLNGGDGNDVYTFASGFGNDSIIDGSGIDTLDLSQLSGDLTVNLASGTYSSINWVGSALENLSTGSGNDNLIGTAANNLLSGGAGNDTLDGSGGSDTLNGGDGNDTYIFTANWGKDSVIDSGGSLDTLDLTAVDSNLTVNLNAGSVSDNLSNAISWSSTIEQVFSGSGNDVMTGNSTLASNLYGGAGNDTITGGAGNDTLIGGFGNDSLLGGAGDDFYSFSPLFGSDTLVDVSGSDTLDLRAYTNNLSVSLSGTTFNDGLGSTVNWSGSTLENLNTGSGNDTLTGNSANNILNGGGGNDQYIFSAGWGQDTIIDSSGNDLVDLSAVTANLTVDLSGASSPAVSDGTDTIVWSGGVIEQALAGSGNDLLTASGSSSLSGGAGNDTLVGSVAGNDTLTGGTGNDIYIVNNANTIINEAGGAGTDSVQSGVSFSIGGNLGNVENLTLTGTANINATGNWQHNLITGNSGNNVLDDGDTGSPYKASGADTLSGGAGNDTYLVNNTGDVINEAAGAGVDAVQSSVSYSIGGNMGNVENLTLTGTANINAAGNWQANVLTGNSGNNVLDDGNENSPYTVSDTLIGGLGNDSLIGGKGNDVYIFNLGDGVDTITENDSTAGNMDTVQFNSSVIQSHVAFFMSGNNLQIGYTDNSTDQITINNQSLSSGTVEKFLLSNGKFLTSSDVNSIIQSMSSYAGSHGESFSSLSDVRNNADLMNIIAAGWHS